MSYNPEMRSSTIINGFYRFIMEKNLGKQTKKFAQIGQCIRIISREPVSGSPSGLWDSKSRP